MFPSSIVLLFNMLTCRARADSGGWRDKSVLILHEDGAKLPLTSELRVLGSSTTFLFSAGRPLTRCWIDIPGASNTRLAFPHGHASPAVGRFRYHGTGLERGQCGVAVTGLTGADSGVVWGRVEAPGVGHGIAGPVLMVTAAPPAPELHLLAGTTYKAGDVLSAICIVRGGVPQANMSWYLGEEVIRSDNEDDLPDPSWKWPWENKTISQTLLHKVTAADNGRELICRINHLALYGIVEAKQRISVAGQSCGKRGYSRPGLVSGGTEAEVGQFPWHAVIYRAMVNSITVICGGTLISPNTVISAAHCFFGNRQKSASLFRVAVGKVLAGWDEEEIGAQRVGVKELVLNQRYADNTHTQQHDIAIVVLDRPVTLTATVDVACIDWFNEHDATQLAEGRGGIATGFGWREDGKNSDRLQYITLPWIPEATCWDAIPEQRRRYYTSDKFCAGYMNASKSVCPGDSGGGLVFEDNATRQYFLRGIVSTSFSSLNHSRKRDGCFSQRYTGFTRVSVYLEWLAEKMNITLG